MLAVLYANFFLHGVSRSGAGVGLQSKTSRAKPNDSDIEIFDFTGAKNKNNRSKQNKGEKMSTKAFKSEKIEKIKEKVDKAQVAILTDYKGLSVEEIMKLRRSLQQTGGDYMVTKNTLTKLAIKGTPFEILSDSLKGPSAIAFGFEDQVSPAKALAKFIKEAKKGEIVAAVLDGKLLSAQEAKALANLPSKEELYAKMLGSINSPATGIANSINAVLSQLTRAMAAVRDQKQ